MLMACDGVHGSVLEALTLQGIMQCRADEFGDPGWALDLSAVKLRPSLIVSDRTRDAVVPRDVVQYEHLSKVELAALLLADGWSFARFPGPLTPESPTVFMEGSLAEVSGMLLRSCGSPTPLRKGRSLSSTLARRVTSCACCACLCCSRCLDGPARTDREYKDLLLGAGVGEIEAPEEVLPPADEELMPLVPLAPPPMDVGPLMGARRFAPANGGDAHIVVRYDNFSHAHGRQRAYVACSNPSHARCFKYTLVDNFQNDNQVCAFLYAWSAKGPELEASTSVGCRATRTVLSRARSSALEASCKREKRYVWRCGEWGGGGRHGRL